MTDCITISTGARLHFGLMVAGPPDRRSYGGLGLMIDAPRFSLTARRADRTLVHASSMTQPRIEEILHTLEPDGVNVEIKVHAEIPAHTGLGSGTQLSLAVGTAWSRLQADPVSIEELARRLGRGTRSVVGALGFEQGGLIGQHIADDSTSPRPEPARQVFPEVWRIVLVTPPDDVGLSGEHERKAFREMPPMTDGQLQQLDELQTQLMTLAGSQDFQSFSEVLQMFGRIVGEYFSPLQSGTYANHRMAELSEVLIRHRVRGVGQTSWGPTLFALCADEAHAEFVADQIREWESWSDCLVRIVAGKNSGATICTD